jgi:hypothetical protein
MGDSAAMTELIRDLQWQVTQMRQRGVTTNAGAPFKPAHYSRGLDAAIAAGGEAVVDFVRSYVHKAPTAAFGRLRDADALDLSPEALVFDEQRSYAVLFTDEDREAVRERLAPHAAAVQERLDARRERQAAARARIREEGLPDRWDLSGKIAARQRQERATR